MDAHNEIAPHAEQCHLRDVVCLMTIFQECWIRSKFQYSILILFNQGRILLLKPGGQRHASMRAAYGAKIRKILLTYSAIGPWSPRQFHLKISIEQVSTSIIVIFMYVLKFLINVSPIIKDLLSSVAQSFNRDLPTLCTILLIFWHTLCNVQNW